MSDPIREKSLTCVIDLMKRHAAGHSQEREGKRKRPPSYSKNGRVSQACKACATSKLKCDEEKPCHRCRERNLICDWPQEQGQSPLGNDAYPEPLQQAPQNQHGPHYDTLLESPIHGQANDYTAPVTLPNQLVTPDVSMENYLPPEQLDAVNVDGMSVAYEGTDRESGILSIDGTFFPNFIPDSLIPSARSGEADPPSTIPQDYAHYGVFDHNLHLDFDLTDVDYGLIDFFNNRGAVPEIQPDAGRVDGNNDRFDVDSGIAIGAEAYQRSSLSAWKPTHEDHTFADRVNLSVPKAINSPHSSPTSSRQILSERLLPSSRDLIFGMVLQGTQKDENLTRIMKSFPNAELLDSLIQSYFECQRHQIDSWIHGPTFRPNSEEPDMLAAVAAAGAVRSPISTIRKLGYALLEIARLQMSVKFENDNSKTRDLRPSQTFALVIEIGIWSGNRRKMEIAESFQQPLLTMLRRGLRFRRSLYSTNAPHPDDMGETLDRKWHGWVEQESFKRLAYHLFLHDAQSAVMLNINPLISYAELELPFPAIRQLWEAKTAYEWKEVYLTVGGLGSGRLPSLADSLHDMSQLTAFRNRIDLQLATFVVLHGLSALINEYHRLKFISRGTSKHWHALVINSRQQELSEALQHFRMVYQQWPEPLGPGILLVCEVISMFLYMSLEELQLFAGKEDKQEARRVYHRAIEWINSVDSRRAIWHAGQVIRAARSMPQGSLTGFFAIGVYYAGLALWSYSVVSKANDAKIAADSSHSPSDLAWPTVSLDAEDMTDALKFISLGCGCPALQGPRGPAMVSDASLTMHVIQGVLRTDAPHENLAPLVLSLSCLISDLGNAVRSHVRSTTHPERSTGALAL
ncbi:hypothetical protein MW887_012050 [Aspergillus wentii]|nr:hypothetical protein MW887_012050 [Aspergillus wentii]